MTTFNITLNNPKLREYKDLSGYETGAMFTNDKDDVFLLMRGRYPEETYFLIFWRDTKQISTCQAELAIEQQDLIPAPKGTNITMTQE